MCFELNSISRVSKKPIYCIQYRSNQGVKFAEMAMNIIGKKFYLFCPAKRCYFIEFKLMYKIEFTQ